MFSDRLKLSRRMFLELFSSAALMTLLPAIVSAKPDYRNDKNIPEQRLQSRDGPGFYIRSANPFLGVDVNTWGLAIF